MPQAVKQKINRIDITIKNIESQIKYHEDAIKELDKNDPNYKNDLEYHTEKLRELREELKNLKNDNRNFALKAFKEVLEATGNFIVERVNDYAHIEVEPVLLRKHFKKSL